MRFLFFILLNFSLLIAKGQSNFNIINFGALPTSLNNASAIQKAIDSCWASGGGNVVVPPGIWVTGTIVLKSKVTLEVQTGAILSGSLSLANYPEIRNQSFRSIIDEGCQRSLIYAENANQLRITGGGIIDGNGFLPPFAGEDSKNRPFLVRIVSGDDIKLDNVSFKNSGFWMLHVLNCSNVMMDKLLLVNHGNSNNDGINLDCVNGALVRNCIVESSDDAIAIKSTGDKFCENILVENCLLKTAARGVKIGTESVGGFRNITIKNCNADASVVTNPLVLPGQTGFSINSVDGAILEDITIDNVSIRGYRIPFLLRLGDRGKLPDANAPVKGPGIFRRLTLSNISATATDAQASIISGIPGFDISDISLENITILQGGYFFGDAMHPDSVPENIDAKPSYDMFGTNLPASSFFVRHAKNISFNNVCVNRVLPDSRPAFVFVDVKNTSMPVGENDNLSTCYNNTALNTPMLNQHNTLLSSNPLHDQLVLDLIEPAAVKIYQTNGIKIFEQKMDAGMHSIDLSGFVPGLLIVNIVQQNGTYQSHQLLKN